ncbi:PAS domain-containing protein [Algoriphagus faecimaris]|nr:PAS domain-containing protein [Algoriphagus faecimaris]
MVKISEFWSPLFDTVQVGLALTNSQFELLHVNASFEKYLGKARKGEGLGDFFDFSDQLDQLEKRKITSDFSFFAKIKAPQNGSFFLKVLPKFCEDGESILWTISIVEQKQPSNGYLSHNQIEKQLSQSDERFKKLVSSMDDLIFTLDKDFRHTGVYGRALENGGLTEDFFLGKTGDEILGKELAQIHNEKNQEALNGSHIHYEWSVGEDDTKKCFLTKLAPLVEADGEIFGVVGMATDITDQKKNFEKLQKANSRYELVNKATNEVIYDWNIPKEVIFWEGSFSRVLGHKSKNGNQFSLQDWESWVYPEDLPKVFLELQEFLQDPTKDYWTAQYRIKNQRGRYFYVLEMGYLIRDDQGNPIRMIGSLRDVNHEMVLKNRLRASYQRLSEFRKALDQSTNIIVTDLDGVILEANQSTCDLSGYSKEELIGSHTRINQSGFHSKTFYKKMWDTIKGGREWKGELKNKRKDGSHYWVFTSIFPLRDKDDKIYRFLAVRTDITEQKEAQEKVLKAFEKVQRSEKKYSDLFQKSPIPMWIYSVDSLTIVDVNQAAVDNYGYSREEFLRLSIFDLRPEREIEEVKKSIESTPYEFGIFKRNFVHKKKSGDEIQVEVSSIPIHVEGIRGKMVIANDITQSLNYLSKIEKQNEILKEIAWTQSHIVRAPLARLLGLANLIKEGLVDGDEREEFLDHIYASAMELDKVIQAISDRANSLEN